MKISSTVKSYLLGNNNLDFPEDQNNSSYNSKAFLYYYVPLNKLEGNASVNQMLSAVTRSDKCGNNLGSSSDSINVSLDSRSIDVLSVYSTKPH